MVVVALLLAGCASSPATMVLEWHGSDEGLVLANQAADEWTTTCGAGVIVGRDNGGAPLTEVTEDFACWRRSGETSVDADGRITSIVVRVGRNERAVLAHEFGHALGIWEHRGVIMETSVRDNSDRHVSPADCALLPR